MTVQQHDGLFRELHINDPLTPTIGQCVRKAEQAVALANVTSDYGVKVEQWNEHCRLMQEISAIILHSNVLAGRVALHSKVSILYEDFTPVPIPDTPPGKTIHTHVVLKAAPEIVVNRMIYCRQHVRYANDYLDGEYETVLLPKIEVKLPMEWIIEQSRQIVTNTRREDKA